MGALESSGTWEAEAPLGVESVLLIIVGMGSKLPLVPKQSADITGLGTKKARGGHDSGPLVGTNWCGAPLSRGRRVQCYARAKHDSYRGSEACRGTRLS